MTTTATAQVLRHRAQHLRQLAVSIESTPAMGLEHAAGDQTWRGPRPALCHAVLVANLAQLHQAVEDLRAHAWQLERQARDLDAAAALIAPGIA